MVNAETVDLSEVRSTIKLLNESGLAEKKIIVIGKKKEDLLSLFVSTVESIPDEKANDLPSEVIVFYNKVTADDESADDESANDESAEEKAPTPAAKKPAPKAKEEAKKVEPAPKAKEEAPVKEKKERKVPAPRVFEKDEFGYVVGTGANLINRAIIDSGDAGTTKAEMEAASGRTANSHLYAIIHLKKIPVVQREGRFYYEPEGMKKKAALAPKPAPKGKK